MFRLTLNAAATMFLLFAGGLIAAVPQIMTYQGVLADAGGQPLDGTYDLTFAIYDAAAGGTPLWQEPHLAVPITDGAFSILLGSLVALPSDLFNSPDRWIGISVNGGEELSPRRQFGSVPFAMHAQTASALEIGGGGPRTIRCITDDTEVSGTIGVIKSVIIPANSLTDFFRISLLVDAIGSTSDFCEREYELHLRVNGNTVFSTSADTLYRATLLAATAAKHAEPNSWFIHKADSQHGVIVEIESGTETIIELLGVLRCGTGTGSTTFRRMLVEYAD